MHSGRATAEGDDLYFEVRGHGPALLMIPGGGGDGNAYAAVAERLSDEFKVITYDRRACARSTMKHPERFCVAQQSRDAVAVLRATGETSAFIVGNSSGAVIALDMAKTQPEAVAAIVAHEPPLALLHPDSANWRSFFRSVREARRRFGSRVAMLKFALGIGVDVSFVAAFRAVRAARRAQAESPQPYLDRRKVIDFFLGKEMLPVTDYAPDLNALRRIKDKVFLAAGQTSLGKKRFYAEVAPILAEHIGCEMVVFPGHHASFVDMPIEWTARLRDTLHRASGARL
jgi:pimeloyl-ACP methyl ester carboxylesterase